jgi:hypothetical protein
MIEGSTTCESTNRAPWVAFYPSQENGFRPAVDRLQILVYLLPVADCNADRGRFPEHAFHYEQLSRTPNIIPIADKNEISSARLYCSLKILGATDIEFVNQKPHWEWCAFGEVANNLDAAVGGRVVTYDQLVGQTRLADKAFELVPDKPFAIVHGHRD